MQSLADTLDSVGLPPPVVFDPVAAEVLNGRAPAGWHLPIASPRQLTRVFDELLWHRLSATYDP